MFLKINSKFLKIIYFFWEEMGTPNKNSKSWYLVYMHATILKFLKEIGALIKRSNIRNHETYLTQIYLKRNFY